MRRALVLISLVVIVAGAGAAPAAGHRVVALRGAHSAVVVELRDDGTIAPLWRGSVGPQGEDGEWRRLLSVDGDVVKVWEERDDVSGCDGVPLRLYPRRLDLASGQLVAVGSNDGPVASEHVVAARGAAPAGLPSKGAPVSFRFTSATSAADDGGSAEGLTPPGQLDDGDARTAWNAGAAPPVLIARASAAGATIVALRVIPGDASSAAAFQRGNRLRRFTVTAGGTTTVVDFAKDPAGDAKSFAEPYWVVLPRPVAATCVTVAIDDVYPGKSKRTAISELVVVSGLDAAGAGALADLAEGVAHGDGDAESQLAARGDAGVTALLTAAAKPGRGADELHRLRAALAERRDARGAAEVVRGLRAAADDDDRERFAEGLVGLDAAVLPLVALLADEDAPLPARLRAAALLAGNDLLLPQCGNGPRELRHAVVVGLSGGNLDSLVAAAGVSSARMACEADLWQAVAIAAHRADAARRGRVGKAIATRLATAHEYELRYRLAQAAAAYVDDDAARAAVTALMANEPEPALRVVAVEALPATPAALPILRAAIDDGDPGVRAAALAALAQLDAADLDAPVIARLADGWPIVRRAAADALAPRCARSAPADGLYHAVHSDADETVRRTAIAALVRCREPRVGKELLAIANDRRVSGHLRAYAATLLGPLGDRSLLPELVTLLRDESAQAPLSDIALGVAAAAAHSLGELGDPRAAPALVDAANDPAMPALRAAAVASLGKLCPPGVHDVLTRAAAAGDALVVRAARLALKECR